MRNIKFSASANGTRNVGHGGGANLRAENIFGLTGADWQATSSYYVPGTGNPAVSTDDYYHSNGVYGMRPYDMLEFGAEGASIAASRGRYAWIVAPDHGSGGGAVWNGSFDFRIGYSNDPGVPPDRATFVHSISTQTAAAQIASFTGSVSGTTLTAGTVAGLITNDGAAKLTGTGVTANTTISSQSTGTLGEAGTYTVTPSQTVAETEMTATQTDYGIYQDPQLLYNPDDATYPFYIYGEGSASSVQHEEGVIKSADLLTWTNPQPTHVTLTFSAWASFQRVKRISTGVWESVGFQNFYPQNGNQWARSKWTSADGLVWEPGATADNVNDFIPSSARVGSSGTSTGLGVLSLEALGSSPYTVTIGADSWILGRLNTYNNNVREGNQWVGRAPVDADINIIDSPSHAKISSAYEGTYPGPNYLQAVSAYIEDGIAHYYAIKGWPISHSIWGVTTYATYANGGGLWQQGLDYYTEIIDATAAAGAAPIGVRASCASSLVTLTWYDALPTQTYRVYRGTTSGSQTTLVGDFTGTSATDSGAPSNAVAYYKVVYLNGGNEQQNRVVSTYVSSSTAFVNAHITRALAGGADASTINRTWLDTFDAWLVSEGLSSNLLFATMVEFGVVKDGSDIISKIFDLGTTRLPRGGDYTTMTSSTTYSATGINSNPAWVNGANTAKGYYGGDRSYLNNIRRKTQITIFAAYQKPGTSQAMLLVSGQFSTRMYLSHDSGSPGTISAALNDATQQKIATKAVSGSATDFHTAALVFDGTDLFAYSDAVAGTAQSGLVIPSTSLNPSDALTGQIGEANLTHVLVSGDAAGLYARTSGALSSQGNLAQYSGAATIIFDKGLSSAQMTSLDSLIRTHYGL